MDKYKAFFTITLVLALTSLSYSLFKQSVYIYDSSLFLFFTWFFWRYGRQLNQNILSMGMIFAALLFHNLGVFGFFSNPPFGLPYDKMLHLFAGIYLTYALYLFASSRMSSKKAALFLAVIGSLGIGAFGELNEFAGWQVFPPKTSFEGGLLDPGVGKFLQEPNYLAYVYIDTIKDMAMNLSGAILTSLVLAAKFLKGRPKK